MKNLMLCIAVLVSGCSLKIPDSFNDASSFLLVYHKRDAKPYRTYDFELRDYPKIKNQIDSFIKNNQVGWRYYYMGLLGESVPYIRVYIYKGTNQVAGMSMYKDGDIFVRDYEKNILARQKKDELRVQQLTELLEGIIKSEGGSGL